MSSDLRPICLSHNPPIVLRDIEINSAEGDVNESALTLVARAKAGDHPHCDVVVGAFSYPLMDLACVTRHSGGYWHSGVSWYDVKWLRLLFAARTSKRPAIVAACARLGNQCWPPERAAALAVLFEREA